MLTVALIKDVYYINFYREWNPSLLGLRKNRSFAGYVWKPHNKNQLFLI